MVKCIESPKIDGLRVLNRPRESRGSLELPRKVARQMVPFFFWRRVYNKL